MDPSCSQDAGGDSTISFTDVLWVSNLRDEPVEAWRPPPRGGNDVFRIVGCGDVNNSETEHGCIIYYDTANSRGL